jgi:hypothetical protein
MAVIKLGFFATGRVPFRRLCRDVSISLARRAYFLVTNPAAAGDPSASAGRRRDGRTPLVFFKS